MGYKAAVQILKQAEELKAKVLRKRDLLVDSQAWTDQQKLQTIYHQALVLDLEYALDKKVEQDLWNVGFKNHISALQEITRDKKHLRRSECQALLSWYLEAASGFYLTLLQELCDIFDIDLPFRRRGTVYGLTNTTSDTVNLPQSSSCLYMCQYCLVHLGDIARYRNQRKQAENFYKQAILVSPTSGHPYNQLALLEGSQGDKLSTVFYYIRGIAVKNPFPASISNLSSTLNSMIDRDNPLEKVESKITVNEFVHIFLCTHALLFSGTDLAQAQIGVKSLNTTMTALVATQSFTMDKLIKITAINLYILQYVSGTGNELTKDEETVKALVLELLTGSLSAFLVPVHTLKCDDSLLDYYALPAVKLIIYWIMNDPLILKNTVFTNRLQIWPSLCKLLNNTQQYLKKFDYSKYSNKPLQEDYFLQGFQPFLENFNNLDFKTEEINDNKLERLIRIKRIMDFGIFLTDLNINNSKLIIKHKSENQIIFEPGCIQPDPTNDLLEEMKSFSLTDLLSNERKKEKRGGILKPQGSLEKSREERELLISSNSDPILLSDLSNASSSSTSSGNTKITKKRPKQNVALQSIFKKIEENKQVKFNVGECEKDKSQLNFEQNNSTSINNAGMQFNLPIRTQPSSSFIQIPNTFLHEQQSQPEYLNNLKSISHLNLNGKDLLTSGKVQYSNNHQPLYNKGGYASVNQNYSNLLNQLPSSAIYQNMQYPPSVSSDCLNVDEHILSSSNTDWWSSMSNPTQTYSQPQQQQHLDGHHMKYSFTNNITNFIQPSLQTSDLNKTSNQASGDMFNNTSRWNNFGIDITTNYNNREKSHFEHNPVSTSNHLNNISLRQAMLKETTENNMNMSTTTTTAEIDPSKIHLNYSNYGEMKNENYFYSQDKYNLSNAPGYSLFNTCSWTPNLVGQLRSNIKTHTHQQQQQQQNQDNSINHLTQHSLFTGQGPQSLAQLLEQQQSQKNDM